MTRFISQGTLDDLMRTAYGQVLDEGVHIAPSKGSARELFGVLMELKNPRARVSRSQRRERIFSALGELLWYLSGSDETDQISYYVGYYTDTKLSQYGKVTGAYGPRLFAFDGINQIQAVIDKLNEQPDSRNAVVQICDHEDTDNAPCTLGLQFVIRENKLLAMSSMRSNDLFLGLPHDLFAFSMIQEIIARSTGADLGSYYHSVGSLHLYDKDLEAAHLYIEEGWHGEESMPMMPEGDPWENIRALLHVESNVRQSGDLKLDEINLPEDKYWRDLGLLLCAYKFSKEKKRTKDLVQIKMELDSKYFRSIVQDRIDRATSMENNR